MRPWPLRRTKLVSRGHCTLGLRRMSAAKVSRKHRDRQDRAAAPGELAPSRDWPDRPEVVAALFAGLILLFYAVPLFSSEATIQWDAADAHYSAQKYFSDQIWSGKLPFWTPYVFSGMPFLADMQTGAWYPLNWPF